MSGSAFGTAPVGATTQPCPLGQIHVRLARADGAKLDGDVGVLLAGPDTVSGTVPRTTGQWTSGKILPGEYRVEVPPEGLPPGYQAVGPVTCELPESGTATADLLLAPLASIVVRVTRSDSGDGIPGVTTTLELAAGLATAATGADGVARFAGLAAAGETGRLSLALPADLERLLEPAADRSLTVSAGANPEVAIVLAPRGSLRVVVVDPDSTNRRRIPVRVTATGAEGAAVEAETDDETTEAVLAGLEPGSYTVAATPTRAADDYYTVAEATVELGRGEARELTLEATRARSRIVMSDKATRQEARGLLKDLITAPYPDVRDRLAGCSIKTTTLLLPFTDLAFDDVEFDPDAAYWDDDKEVIAITGWVEIGGVRRQLMFVHTYRPNRLLLLLKFREWKFDRDWVRALGPVTEHLSMRHAFVTLSASATELASADLPAGVSSFLGEEKLDLEQGVNLCGKLEVAGYPNLEQFLEWMGVEESYLTIEGYLAHEANFVFSKEAREKKQEHEKAWKIALRGTIPGRIDPALAALIEKRELTLEIGRDWETKGRPGAVVYNSGSTAVKKVSGKDGGTSAEEKERTIHVKLEDAITVPLPSLAVPWLVVVNEDREVEFTGAFEVEGDWDKPHEDAKLTLEYGTDLTVALFAKELAIHDFKAELALSENKVTLSGEIDLGRREKVAVVEFARALPPTKPSPAGAGKSPSPAPETGPATPPKPGLDLEEKATKPQPAAPTEEELATAPTGSASKPTKARAWDVTVKLKPGVLMGLFDIVKDLAASVESHEKADS